MTRTAHEKRAGSVAARRRGLKTAFAINCYTSRMGSAADRLLVIVKRAQMRLSAVRPFDGLWVGAAGPNQVALLDRAHAALALIKLHDPRRFRRLLADVDRIFVDLLPGAQGAFRPEQRWCSLDQRFVMSASTAMLASTIVHEATHARLCAAGFDHSPKLRARMEAVCMRRELAFANRHAQGAAVRAEVEIGLGLEPGDWTSPLMRELLDEAADQTAREAGVPLWMMRLARGYRDRYASGHAARAG